ELLATTCFVQTHLFAFNRTCVAGDVTRLTELSLEGFIVLDESTCDAMTNSACLTALAAPVYVDFDVKGLEIVSQMQRLAYNHAPSFTGKIIFNGATINDDLPTTFFHKHACD